MTGRPDAVGQGRARTPQPTGDADLLARIRARDEHALAELRTRYHALLLARIELVTLNHELAEEVAQDLWFHLWLHPEAIDLSRGGIGTWLRTVAHRRAVDCVRTVHAAHRRDVSHGLQQAHEVDPGPEQDGTLAWYRPRLSAALDQLSEYQRTAIVLHHFGDLSHTEIARRLQIAVGASRTRYRDGILNLRRLLADLSTGHS